MAISKLICLVSTLLCVSTLLHESVAIKRPHMGDSPSTSPMATGFEPNWESLDARPLPSWYDESKVGIFIHWGVFSVPAFGCKEATAGEWYWYYLENGINCTVDYHKKAFGEGFKYEDFAPMFKATLWDPEEWASIIQQSGAKYVVLTSKHHEGWTNFPSPVAWNWNSVDAGPGRDLVGELTKAVRKTGLKMGLYHSLFEWYHPLYLQDAANNFTTQYYVDQILMPELHQIVEDYQPVVIWADGDWNANATYWKSKEFLAWLYNDSPVKNEIVVNDRWGQDAECKHGGYYTCDDRYNPGHLLPHKWENCFTIDGGSWGFAQNSPIENYLTIEQILYQIITTVSCGGNALINIGPTANGDIAAIYQERLMQMGEWLKIHGEGIYESIPWREQNETYAEGEVWYTQSRDGYIYGYFTGWPTNNQLTLQYPIPNDKYSFVDLLGYDKDLTYTYSNGALVIQLPDVPISELPTKWTWGLRFTEFK